MMSMSCTIFQAFKTFDSFTWGLDHIIKFTETILSPAAVWWHFQFRDAPIVLRNKRFWHWIDIGKVGIKPSLFTSSIVLRPGISLALDRGTSSMCTSAFWWMMPWTNSSTCCSSDTLREHFIQANTCKLSIYKWLSLIKGYKNPSKRSERLNYSILDHLFLCIWLVAFDHLQN